MNFQRLRATGATVALFAGVYAPAFIAVSLLRPSLKVAIPLIMGISLALALLFIALLARKGGGFSEFGFQRSQPRYVGLAVGYGLPLALLASWLDHLFPSPSPIDTSLFPLWLSSLYFVVGASIQEEVIFRGLLQSFLGQRWQPAAAIFGRLASTSVVVVAVLFGAIHAPSGPAVAAAALVLGVAAGEFRRRSGSLLPAIIIHALFNAVELVRS